MAVAQKFIDPGISRETSLQRAVHKLASTDNTEERGAFYTRQEVVSFMLDLAGYTSNKPLYMQRMLEPSSGSGSFLYEIVERLLTSWSKNHVVAPSYEDIKDSIRAVELHIKSISEVRQGIYERLIKAGLTQNTAQKIVSTWLIQGDFLLMPIDGEFDYILGNPPYIRQESIPVVLMNEYRRLYKTIYDRADIYVPFIERSLDLLCPEGAVTFICSDRWMKNKYGQPLRKKIAKDYHLKYYVDMYDVPAFLLNPVAYPAITTIARSRSTVTRVSHRPEIEIKSLKNLAKKLLGSGCDSDIKDLNKVVCGSSPWLLESSDQVSIVKRLETVFPSLEEAHCKVGIGVATGADKVFIGNYDDLDIETDRKMALVNTKDISGGRVEWKGKAVINPYCDNGGLVNLECYPRLNAYLQMHKDVILARHCAKKDPSRWYKTIDKITPSLSMKPKLLIPDIKGEAHVVYESGEYYPHHNLYYITSEEWDLRALQAILLSSITKLFISTYSVKMRGGYLRFQAQYLRRIRLPLWDDVAPAMRKKMIQAGHSLDILRCNEVAFELYNLSAEEQDVLGGTF